MSQFISLEATGRTLNFSQTLQAELASFLSSNHANITQTARCSSFDKSLVAPPPNQPSKCNAPPNQTKPNQTATNDVLRNYMSVLPACRITGSLSSHPSLTFHHPPLVFVWQLPPAPQPLIQVFIDCRPLGFVKLHFVIVELNVSLRKS